MGTRLCGRNMQIFLTTPHTHTHTHNTHTHTHTDAARNTLGTPTHTRVMGSVYVCVCGEGVMLTLIC